MTPESFLTAPASMRRPPASADPPDGDEFEELLTVDDVAALLKVSRSWVYEHTRARGPRTDRLPFVKIGKYVRFQSRAVADFLAKRSSVA
jgi:excisionase family DNA binding protein